MISFALIGDLLIVIIWVMLSGFLDPIVVLGAIQIIRDTFLALFRPPPPMSHFLSIFTSEITNKNCPVTFLLPPPLPPKVSRII